MKFIIFISTLLFTLNSLAFNWEKCRQVGPGSAGALTSSTQFTSSWGLCSIFGKTIDGGKKLFIAQTHKALQIDVARGEGEYLYVYAELSGCPAM